MTTDLKAQKQKKRKRLWILLICIVLLIAFAVSLHVSNTCIKVTHFTLESEKVASPLRFAVISDLHSREFKDNNEKLFSLIKEQDPDIILLVGDIISNSKTDEEGLAYFKEIYEQFCAIAPVYTSLGNHERYEPATDKIKATIQQTDAFLLENSYKDINLNGDKIRLFGLSYYRSWDPDSNAFISDCLQTEPDVFALLLCHNPEFYQWGIKNYPIDLTVSGHTHGGMFKLPLIGPVYAPEQGLFPKYGAGFFEEENGCLAVTTGLASSPEYMPRIFNRPEIMIIDVK